MKHTSRVWPLEFDYWNLSDEPRMARMARIRESRKPIFAAARHTPDILSPPIRVIDVIRGSLF
jgi:hypothetical protein